MRSIPRKIKELLHKFMQLFTSEEFAGDDYKTKLLQAAQNDEEREDLQELFQSTADFYAQRKAITESGMAPGEYLLDQYMSAWKEEHPDATADELKAAKKEYENIISQGIMQELDNLQNDSADADEEPDETESDTASEEPDSADDVHDN